YNALWMQYAGLSPAQASTPASRAAVHPDDVVHCAANWAESVRSGETYEVECRLRRASDGAYRWHACRAWALRESPDGGAVLGWCGTFADVDDRRRRADEASHLKRFLESVVDNMPDAVFVKDAKELRFVRVNRVMEQIAGFTNEQAMGRNDYDFFPKEEAD